MFDFKEFSSPDELHVWVEKTYSQAVLDAFDISKIHWCSPLSLYLNASYESINKNLRKGVLSIPFLRPEYLQNDLCKQRLPESVVAYRFLSFRELLYLWRKTLFGKTFEYPAFISTTLIKNHYTGSSRNRFCIKINANKSVHAMYLPELKGAPVQEYELLFAHHVTVKRHTFCKYEVLAKEIKKEYRGVQQPDNWLSEWNDGFEEGE